MTETLYSESLKVVFKCQDTEDRLVTINVTVEVQTTTSPLHRKDLLVRLTDERDPFFLYNLCLGEEDFQSLKTQQGLLVDFSAFPQKFIALLQQCQNEESKDSPKFVLQFVIDNDVSSGGGTLKIIETNPFKHLTHLSLNLLSGNDNDVKKYLATCLKTSLERKKQLEEKLAATEHDLGVKLDHTRQQLSNRTKELDQLRNESGGRSERLTANHAHQLNLEREKSLKIQEEMQQRYDKDRKELESSYQKTLQQKESRLSDVENMNKDLTDRRYRAEATIREQKTKLGVLEEEHRRCRGDLQQTRRENSSLEAERHAQDKAIQQLKTRVAVLEQELLDKEQLVARITASLDASQQQKEQLDERRSEQQVQIKKLEATIKTMSEEIIKGNEIIKKLQDELRGYIGKVKLKNEVTTRQERAIQEKEQSFDKAKRELEDKTKRLKESEEEAAKLKEQVALTLSKLEESKGLLKTNENVINWLNKQLNEKQITSRRNPPPPPTHPSTHHHSLPSFDHHSYNQPAPHYSTPIGVAPQPPHISVSRTTPVPPINTSPHGFTNRPPGASGNIPTPNVPPQVLYNPGKNNKENQSPNPASEGNSIDPKYFSRPTDVITIRSISPASEGSPPKPHTNKPALKQSTRLSQQVINKASLNKANVRFQHPPPAVSAYFSGAKPKPS